MSEDVKKIVNMERDIEENRNRHLRDQDWNTDKINDHGMRIWNLEKWRIRATLMLTLVTTIGSIIGSAIFNVFVNKVF